MTRKFLLTSLACAALAACQTPSDYPSLARRPGELAPAAAPPAPAPPPPADPALPGKLAEIKARADAAAARFAAARPAAESAVAAARGTAEGSDARARASVALAALESPRGDLAGALADIDSLYIAGQTAGADVAAAVPVRDAVERMLADEDAVLAALATRLGG